MFDKLFSAATGSSAFDFAKDIWAQENAEGMQHSSQAFGHSEAGLNRDFQERMRATQYQTAMTDMNAAGLNPMLAFQQGGAGTPGGAMGTGAAGHSAGITKSNLAENAVTAAQVENVNAQTDLAKATADNIRSTGPVNIDRMKQEIDQSIAQVENIRQQTVTGAATAENVKQQTDNLRETISQIKSTVQHLNSMTALNFQQITALSGQIGKTHAETQEILQRVKANLPDVQRALSNMELIFKRYQEGGQRLNQEAQGSFLGNLDRAMRALRGSLQLK